MKDLLPSDIFRQIQNHYLAAVSRTESHYKYHSGDEDSLTGALGGNLIQDPIIFEVTGQRYSWKTEYFKFPGRGKGALEKESGADGIFQIEISDLQGSIVRRKGLLFQAKKKWRGKDSRLLEQARLLNEYPLRGVVINYTQSGFRACLAEDVVNADGNRTRLKSVDYFKLGEFLSEQFLPCRVGNINLYYDYNEKAVIDTKFPQVLVIEHVINSKISLVA